MYKNCYLVGCLGITTLAAFSILIVFLLTSSVQLGRHHSDFSSNHPLIGDGDDSRKNIPINSTIGEDSNICYCFPHSQNFINKSLLWSWLFSNLYLLVKHFLISALIVSLSLFVLTVTTSAQFEKHSTNHPSIGGDCSRKTSILIKTTRGEIFYFLK